MLSKKEIICPNNLLKIAKNKGPVKAVIVNAGKKVAIESTRQAVKANLIDPVFVGDKSLILKIAKDIDPSYHDAFVKATNSGVEHLCYSCRLTTKSICIDKRIRMIL